MKFVTEQYSLFSQGYRCSYLYEVQQECKVLTQHFPSVVPELRCRKFDIIFVLYAFLLMLNASKHWSLNSPSLACSKKYL